MSAETFYATKEDVRKMEMRESKKHGGRIPPDCEASIMKSIVDKAKAKQPPDVTTANLELPEQPTGSSSLKSADARYHLGTGSGRFSGDPGTDALRQPVVQASSAREDANAIHKHTLP